MSSILSIGTVAFDSIETPFGKADHVLGGSATYITLAAKHFVADVGLVAVVGDDFPEEFLQVFRDHRVNTEGLQVDALGKTFSWGGKYHFDLNQRDTLWTDLNVLATFEPVVPEAYRRPSVVCLGNLAPNVQLSVIDQLENDPIILCDTMNFWIDQTPEALKEVIGKIDVLLVNDSEARELTGESNLVKAARAIQTMGPQTVCIKKGEHGALLFAEEAIFSAPAYPLEDIFDPTGAGDTFMGGMAGYLASRPSPTIEDYKRGIIMGSALASFTVEAFGTDRLKTLTSEALAERVTAFDRLTRVTM
jgi:sugar/nucleoside kinase (ribokinase family)